MLLLARRRATRRPGSGRGHLLGHTGLSAWMRVRSTRFGGPGWRFQKAGFGGGARGSRLGTLQRAAVRERQSLSVLSSQVEGRCAQ